MKSLLLVLAVVMLGCGGGKQKETQGASSPEPTIPPQATLPTEPPKAKVKKPLTKEESAKVIEAAIRNQLKKPTGELTKADLEKVTTRYLLSQQLTDVKGLEKLTKLTDLYLDKNQLTEVKSLEKLTKLTKLGLSKNKLTDVKGLEKLTQLTLLYLADNQLTEVPKEPEKLTQLTSLDLSGNNLTDLKGLEKLTKLGGLILKDNPDLTKAQIAELQKALPKCKIYSDFD